MINTAYNKSAFVSGHAGVSHPRRDDSLRDRLSPLFPQSALSARVYSCEQVRADSGDHIPEGVSYLHILRRGVLRMVQPDGAVTIITEPTVLLTLKPAEFTFQAGSDTTVILRAAIRFDAGMLNALARTLPQVLIVRLASVPELGQAAGLLFSEAFGSNEGRQAALDRLMEYFIVLLLRTSIRSHLLTGEGLTGLTDPKLSDVLQAMQQQPEKSWSLGGMARIAGMSRSRFAAYFLQATGQTPFEYLAAWRIGVAQGLLKRGEPLKMVAPAVGYSSAAALSRAFCQQVGSSPTEWLLGNGRMRPSYGWQRPA